MKISNRDSFVRFIMIFVTAWFSTLPTFADSPAGTPDPHKPIFYGSDCKTPMPGRLVLTKGDEVKYSWWSDKYSKMKPPEETPRKTLFAQDAATVFGKIAGVGAADATPTCLSDTYTLEDLRATLTLTPVPTKDTDTDVVKSVSVLTGPTEHWYMGFDLPVSNSKTLKYDATSHSLQPQDTNPQLYISANFQLGDTATPSSEVNYSTDWWKEFAIKAMVQASNRPLDSVGLGLGYRIPNISFLGVDLSSVTAFGGYFRNKQDAIVNGVAQTNGDIKYSWRIGITFDVNTAVKWVKWN